MMNSMIKGQFLALFLLAPLWLIAQYGARDKAVMHAIERSYAATVRIWGIDSANGRQNSAQFSGVVVTRDGWILTAAHAIVSGKYYLVNFVDGKSVRARAHGRMGIKSMQGRPDIGLLKIVGNGDWPVAEMGWSDGLQTNDLCISIAYPTPLGQTTPTIRVGVVSIPQDQWGFMVSTCKMEPGDSGGPLFDNWGRVIAIHSRIDVKEEINYESPVNLFRQYWDSLVKEVDYTVLPEPRQSIERDTLKSPFFKMENLVANNKASTLPVINIESEVNGLKQTVLGTAVVADDASISKTHRASCWILTKSSLVGNAIKVEIDGRQYAAEIFSRNEAHDLALLRIQIVTVPGVLLSGLKKITPFTFADLGKSLITYLPAGNTAESVLSSQLFNQSNKLSRGVFGANANFIDRKIIITQFSPNSPAARAGLQLKDEVKVINGVPVSEPPHYGRELMRYAPGDTVTIDGIRNGEPFHLSVIMGDAPSPGNHPAYHFAGGRSVRFDGFDSVFAHDAKLRPEQCGGPVFAANGECVGLNIARFSRTCALALPAEAIFKFVWDALSMAAPGD